MRFKWACIILGSIWGFSPALCIFESSPSKMNLELLATSAILRSTTSEVADSVCLASFSFFFFNLGSSLSSFGPNLDASCLSSSCLRESGLAHLNWLRNCPRSTPSIVYLFFSSSELLDVRRAVTVDSISSCDTTTPTPHSLLNSAVSSGPFSVLQNLIAAVIRSNCLKLGRLLRAVRPELQPRCCLDKVEFVLCW